MIADALSRVVLEDLSITNVCILILFLIAIFCSLPLTIFCSLSLTNFLVEVFIRHGIPQIIVTYNRVQFTSDYTKIFLDLYDVYIHFVNIHHPESNGLVEIEIKKLENF